MPTVSELLSRNVAQIISDVQTWSIFYNALEQGCTGDGTTDDYAALNTLFNTTITTDALVIFPRGSNGYRIASNLTIPSNVVLYFVGEATLKPDTGVTVAINGGIIAGVYQIFSGDGTIIGNPIVENYFPQWWGATGDGVTDDTDAITAMKNTLTLSGGTAFFVKGDYLVTDSALFNAPAGAAYVGDAALSNFKVGETLTSIPAYTVIPALTASRALVSNSIGIVTSSAVTATELNYLSGVTSNLQTQLNAKAPLISPVFTISATLPTATTIGTLTATELGYVHGVTSDIQTQFTGKQSTSEKGNANGYASLDSGAKVPIAQIPDSVLGQLEYQGTWNATTDSPTLPAATGVKGHYYVVSTGGTYETIVYVIGDWIVSNGTIWQKVDNTDAVTTVFGRIGAVVAATNDYTWAQINKASSSLADITDRSASDLTSGTLPVGRIPTGIDATNINTGVVTNAEFNYLDGVTSALQTQLDDKAPLTHVGAGGSSQHPDATISQSGFISAADLIAFRALTPTGLGTYAVPVGQIFSLWGRYSFEQDSLTGELVIYEI